MMNNERANLCIYFCVKGSWKKKKKKSRIVNLYKSTSGAPDVMDDGLIPQRQHRETNM